MSDFSHSSSGSTLPSRVHSTITTSSHAFLRSHQFSHPHTHTDEAISALHEIIGLLRETALPGPMTMISAKKLIGQGGQFVVYQQRGIDADQHEQYGHLHREVAVKQPKFDLNLAKPQLDLAGQQTQLHLEHILVEVRALTTPLLQRHENIVKLLSWSFDELNFHHPISLVLELAYSNLEAFLSEGLLSPEAHWYQRYVLCGQIASGIDAIHGCHMVHGDLKPQNILIFQNGEHGYTAKLADFGLSIVGLDFHDTKKRLGGTEGWQAPDVLKGQSLGPEDLIRCDNYSFGLLAWSTIFGDGKPPSPAHKQDMDSSLLTEMQTLMHEATPREAVILSSIPPSILSLLQCEVARIPDEVAALFDKSLFCCDVHRDFDDNCEHVNYCQDEHHAFAAAETDAAASELWHPMPTNSKIPRLAWELPDLPEFFLRELFFQFDENPSSVLPEVLFASFLLYTSLHTGYTAGLQKERGREFALTLLTTSARNGYVPAQALVPDIYEFYGTQYPPDIETSLVEWLKFSVISGSISAKAYLATLDPEALANAKQQFHDQGGYGQLLSHRSPAVSRLHWLAAFGSLSELRNFFESNQDPPINVRTSDGETPLYLACARGSWEIASELLDHGADPSLFCTGFGITCLHWLFAFEQQDMSKAATKLVDRGANIDALVWQPVPFFHSPFILPAGTPLHWATVLEDDRAVRTLVDHGADPAVRDGSDPYKYDNDVRVLTNFSGSNYDGFSVPHLETRGLSSVDIASANHYPGLFQALIHHERFDFIEDVDEEGFSLVHRLSASSVHRTRCGLRFSLDPIKGGRAKRDLRLCRTLEAIKSLGCNLDQLTVPQRQKEKGKQMEPPFPSHTPLMLAARRGRPGLVRNLISTGADVNTENDWGETALYYLCGNLTDSNSLETARDLIRKGADVHHRDRNGNTVMCAAAYNSRADLMELFLSIGADITEKDNNPVSLTFRDSVFAIMTTTAVPFFEEKDKRLARLLRLFVLSHPDTGIRKAVVESPSRGGRTLLHAFAMDGFRFSIEALIELGADVNALMTRSTWDEGMDPIMLSWQETPLSAAKWHKEMVTRRMGDDSRYSMAEFEDLCVRADTVIRILRDAGGLEVPRNTIRNHVPCDASNAGTDSVWYMEPGIIHS